MKTHLFWLILVFISTVCRSQELSVSKLFSDGVVLQQKSKVPIWGWGAIGEKVTVTGSWGNTTIAKVDASGKWKVSLQTPKFGGPFQLKITSKETTKSIKDVLIGEVWICSGQSNMGMPLRGWMPKDSIYNYKEEIRNANYPEIRMFNVKKSYNILPQKDVGGSWLVCNPENAGRFSAVAYFFGRELHKNLDVPIGLLNSSFGGSPIEAWLPEEELTDLSRFHNLEKELVEVKANVGVYDAWIKGLEDAKFNHGRNLLKFEETILCDQQYKDLDYNDSNWLTTDLPSNWEDLDIKNYDGVVWYRKDFELTKYDANQPLYVYLGKLLDVDECYLNGQLIGKSYQESDRRKARRYEIPKKLLRTGKNTLAIRIIDVWGEAGFVSEEKPKIIQNEKPILQLYKDWKYLPSAEYINRRLQCFDDENYAYTKKPYLPFIVEQKAPTALYNTMIKPIIPYKIKGFIWYQGESNTNNPSEEYEKLFSKLIKRWRSDWNAEIPFYFAQIAPLKNYDNDKGKNTAELREAQFKTQKLPKTGMAVLLDLGDKYNIHPHKKQDVGKRLAYWALNKDYKKEVVFSGPEISSAIYKNGKVFLSFKHIADGLVLKNSEENNFEIAGKDGVFYPAEVAISGDELIIWSEEVNNPTQVKYAFTNWVEPTLYNKAGLPASSFKIER